MVNKIKIKKLEHRVTEKNLTIKRPGTGINPMRWNKVLGQIARKDYQEDELI